VQDIEPHFTLFGSAFGLEMMLLSILRRHVVVQVPVRYLPRVGESSVTGNKRKAIALGFEMIGYILRTRLRTIGKRPRIKAIPVT
jgi:hypothetical protein